MTHDDWIEMCDLTLARLKRRHYTAKNNLNVVRVLLIRSYHVQEKRRVEKGISYASKVTEAKEVSKLEIRSRMGEKAPL